MLYFSARLTFIVLVDDGRARKRNQYEESVLVFRAESIDDALLYALAWGREQETVYLNERRQKVRWALVGIEEIREIGARVAGREVASRAYHRTDPEPVPFDSAFEPERSTTALTERE